MDKVFDFINNLGIDNKVVLACSYGPDSMCLLDILIKCNVEVVVAHVNHKLREESDEEYKLLEYYCKSNNIVFEGYVINEYPKGNVEAVARDIRYKFFDRVLKKHNSNHLFTAHHGDDLIETMLMRVSRGASFKGYAGFGEISKVNNFNLVRPLIYVTKDEIDVYNSDNNVCYAVDKTNFEFLHTRNIYRHKVLPLLKEINPDVHKKYLKFSKSIIDYYNYVNEEVNSYKTILYKKNKCLDINDVGLLPEFILRLLIESILSDIYKDKISVINDKHVDAIVGLIYSDRPNVEVSLPRGYVAYKFYNIIDIRLRQEVFDYDYILEKEFNINNGYITYINDSDIVKSNYLIRLSSLDVKLPLHIRNRRVGDKISLKGGSKKVGEILSEAKISRWERNIYPIVTDNDGKILWIPGVKKSKYDRQINDKYDIIVKYIKKEKNYEE